MSCVRARSALPTFPISAGSVAKKIVVNPMAPPPADLDEVDLPDYRYAIRSVFSLPLICSTWFPTNGWLEYPSTALVTVRGCTQGCSLCGGSRSAYELNCGRRRPSMRTPAKLVEDIQFIQSFSRTPIFIIGDIRQGGSEYVEEFFSRLRAIKLKNELVFELFWSAGDEFFSEVRRSAPAFSLEITLESADEQIRRDTASSPARMRT